MLPTLLSQEATESCTRHKEEESQKGILGSRTESSQLRRGGESPFEEGSQGNTCPGILENSHFR